MNALIKHFKENFDFERYAKNWGQEEANHSVGMITFDGGDVYDGWIHDVYYIYPDGRLTHLIWESGGYQPEVNMDEEECSYQELLSRLEHGEIPLSKWTNKKGAEFCLDLLRKSSIDIEKVRRRVRDALNKTADAALIMKAAVLFGVKLG